MAKTKQIKFQASKAEEEKWWNVGKQIGFRDKAKFYRFAIWIFVYQFEMKSEMEKLIKEFQYHPETISTYIIRNKGNMDR